jgi:hypothetical protein
MTFVRRWQLLLYYWGAYKWQKMVSMEHREGKEAQRVTVLTLVDCHSFLFSKMKETEKKRNSTGTSSYTSLDKYVFDMLETVVSIFDLSYIYIRIEVRIFLEFWLNEYDRSFFSQSYHRSIQWKSIPTWNWFDIVVVFRIMKFFHSRLLKREKVMCVLLANVTWSR